MIYINEISPTIKLPGLSSLTVTLDYKKELVETIKQIPNAVWHKKHSCWEIPLTSLSRAINNLSNFDSITLNVLKDKEEVEYKDDYELYNYPTTPYPYQLEGIKYGLQKDKFLLLDAPGLGKTLQMTYLALEHKRRDNIEHCLVICGVNSLKHNWKREIQRHSDLSVRILGERTNKKGNIKIGSVQDRIDDLLNPIDEFFVITNIESLRNENLVKAINKGPNKFDMIVVDEAHKCLDYNSIITTDKGDLPIGYIVDNNIECNVLSYNINSRKNETSRVIDKHKLLSSSVIELVFEDSITGKEYYLKCTPDHKIYTKNRGFVEAQYLLDTDEIKSL